DRPRTLIRPVSIASCGLRVDVHRIVTVAPSPSYSSQRASPSRATSVEKWCRRPVLRKARDSFRLGLPRAHDYTGLLSSARGAERRGRGTAAYSGCLRNV